MPLKDFGRNLSTLHACAFLAFIGVLAYAQTLSFPFVHDDRIFILQNPQIRNWQDISGIFQHRSVVGVTDLSNPYYRPVLEVLNRIIFAVSGASSAVYHFINILFHVINGLLIYTLLFRLMERPRFSLCVAALFLLHPVQTEAVACISGVSNLAYVFFGLLMCHSFLNIRKGFSAVLWSILSLFLFGVALLCKEQAIVFPFLVILMRICFKDEDGFKNVVISFILMMTLVAGYFAWRHWLFGGYFGRLFDYPQEFILRIAAIAKSLLMYGSIIIVPVDLHYYRSLDILSPLAWAWFVLLPFVGLLAWYSRRLPLGDRRVINFGAGWFLISIFPVLNIMPLFHEYSHIAQFEHFLYLPSVGFFIVFFILIYHLMDLVPRVEASRVLMITMPFIVFVCFGLTLKQSLTWSSEVALFRKAARHEPQLGRVQMLLGKSYVEAGRFREGSYAYRDAGGIMEGYLAIVEANQNYPLIKVYKDFLKNIYFELANVHMVLQEFDTAINELQRAVDLDAYDPALYNQLGLVSMLGQHHQQARVAFQQAIRIAPTRPEYQVHLGLSYLEGGMLGMAKKTLESVTAKYPDYPPAHDALDAVYQKISVQSQQ